MIDFIREHLPTIVGVVAAVVAGGFAIRFLRARSGRDTTIINQKGAQAQGDVVGRDKITHEHKRH